MKATVNTTDLRAYLKAAKPFVSNKVIPILEDVHIRAAGNEVTLTVSDLENFFQVHIPADIPEHGEVCLPFADLVSFVSTYKDQALNIESCIIVKHHDVKVDGKYKKEPYNTYPVNVSGLKLQGHNPEEFPILPELANMKAIDFSPLLFHELIVAAAFLGTDVLRPVMSGANISKRDGLLTIAATDSHRLYKAEICPYDDEFDIIINGMAVRQAPKIFDTTKNVTVQFNESNAVFEQPGIKLISRLIDGKYPNINAVIPQENPVQVILNKAQLIEAINRVKIASAQSTRQVLLTVTEGQCKLYACDIDFGREMETIIPCRGEGEIEIAFNFKFLLEILAQQLSTEVTIELSSANRAGVIREYHRTYLIMPVMIVKPEQDTEVEPEMEEEVEEEEEA